MLIYFPLGIDKVPITHLPDSIDTEKNVIFFSAECFVMNQTKQSTCILLDMASSTTV